MSEPVKITVQGVLADLENGYTRNADEKNYLGDEKSIGEKYGLNKAQVKDLMNHPKLKGRKTIVQKEPAFILIDEDEDVEESVEEKILSNTPSKITKSNVPDGDDTPDEDSEAESVNETGPDWLSN